MEGFRAWSISTWFDWWLLETGTCSIGHTLSKIEKKLGSHIILNWTTQPWNLFLSETCSKSCALDLQTMFFSFSHCSKKIPKIVSETHAKWSQIGAVSESRGLALFSWWALLGLLLFIFVFSNKHYNSYSKYMCKNVTSIQYMVPGFDPTTFGTGASSHNH